MMGRRFYVLAIVGLVTWLGSGLYVVRGNERAAVSRFGCFLRGDDGRVRLRSSGLHFELPWPLSRVNRVNLNEARTLSIGHAELGQADLEQDLLPSNAAVSQFLTGDKNVLNLQLAVLYRVSESALADYLVLSAAPEKRLAALLEAAAADLVACSGVDFVHPLGLSELQQRLTTRLRRLSHTHGLGLDVDLVQINAVYPPLQVKGDFLDVADARADRERYIQSAHAYAEQQAAQAWSAATRVIDKAEVFRSTTVEDARSRAESFERIVDQLGATESDNPSTHANARQLAMRRLYLEAMEEILSRVAGKVFLESGEPVDLTIFRESE